MYTAAEVFPADTCNDPGYLVSPSNAHRNDMCDKDGRGMIFLKKYTKNFPRIFYPSCVLAIGLLLNTHIKCCFLIVCGTHKNLESGPTCHNGKSRMIEYARAFCVFTTNHESIRYKYFSVQAKERACRVLATSCKSVATRLRRMLRNLNSVNLNCHDDGV